MTQTTANIHPADAAAIAKLIGNFLDAGIERFGEAGFIAAVQIYAAEQAAR